MKPSITLGMIARNEAALIGQAIASVRSLVSEIIVVDTGSTDDTVRIAESFGARVIHRPFDGCFARARNEYLRRASKDWILSLDCDETIARGDLPELARLTRARRWDAYRFPMRNYVRESDLSWKWFPNDGRYLKQEALSGCPGFRLSFPLKLLRRSAGLLYPEGSSVHEAFDLGDRKVTTANAPVIHHFQFLKGGEDFIASKQVARLDELLRCIQRFPGQMANYWNAARTLIFLRRDREALELIARGLRRDPGAKEGRFLRALLQRERGRLSAAFQEIEKLLSLDPRCPDALALKGMIESGLGRNREAKESLRAAIRLRASHVLALNALACLLQSERRLGLARANYERLLRIHPQFYPAWYNLGVLHEASGRLGQAKRCYLRARSLNSEDADIGARLSGLTHRQARAGLVI